MANGVWLTINDIDVVFERDELVRIIKAALEVDRLDMKDRRGDGNPFAELHKALTWPREAVSNG